MVSRTSAYRLAVGALLAAILTSWPPAEARAFCGFYVGRADAHLYNHASQVVMVRDGDRDRAEPDERLPGRADDFALVVPVPTVLQQDQIHIGNANCSSVSTATARRGWLSITTRARVRCRCRRC